MARILIRATSPSGLRFRLGRGWTAAGEVVEAHDFTAEDWAVLQSDPMLHIGPAPDEAAAAVASASELKDRLREAIAALPAEGFGEDGAPKLDALRAALPAGTAGLTKKLVAEVWAGLKAEVPR
ncbi:hypothetical protein [Cereibacter sphaeroides]|uniref:hypothetical protein n=1 Tax=Cereibacter sphaeroides TaxID=1063 RepID=UPI00056CE497|nr:hypothetical protein [Cereibacter sphaeroides]